MFYDYPDSYSIFCRMFDQEVTRDEMYTQIERIIRKSSRDTVAMASLEWERDWFANKRPYYRVWPKVLPMLMSLDVSKVTGDIMRLPHGLNQLLVQLPIDNDLATEDTVRTVQLKTVLTSQGPGMMVSVFRGIYEGAAPTFDTWVFPATDKPLEDILASLRVESELNTTTDLRNRVMGLVATLCMIGDNPDLLQPSLLTKDSARKGLSNEDILRLHAKAKRRGKNGWEVGKSIEVAPHFRRPHPSLVWTGEGRKIPRIIIRKGSLVHRSKVTSIPTGYATIGSQSENSTNEDS